MTASDNKYTSLGDRNTITEEATTPSDIKLIEARTAILLRNTDSFATRNEPTMWILEHMFRPLTTKDYNEYQLLLLSGTIRPPWEKKRKDITSRNQPNDSYFSQQGTIAEGTPTPPVIASQYLPDAPNQTVADKMYIMTPRTRILTITKEHSMVFMIDLSSSLATIETSTGKVMIGSAYNVLKNIVNGLVYPFSLDVSENISPIIIEHRIRITVVAECSQFGSNMNVIPILAEYPTMRVLMQNVLVSVNNVSTVLKNLNDSINTFKQDLGKFRKNLTMKRSKMGYELDVRGDHAQTVEESAESNFSASLDSPTKLNSSHNRKNSVVSLKGDSKSKSSSMQTQQTHGRHSRNKSITSKTQVKKIDTSSTNNSFTTNKKSAHHHHSLHHHRHSSASTIASIGPNRRSTAKDKKDVWGVGKTGSTLSYILRAGLFALNLSSKEGQPSIVLITDGVVKSNIQDESVIRQLTAENIACSVVQIGQNKGFFPGLNFGFVPDNEVLEFLTSATNGKFMFAENCPPITPNDSVDKEIDFSFEPPNIYHHRFLLREIFLDKVKPSRQSRKTKDGNTSGDVTGQGKTEDLNKDPTATTVVDLSSSGMIPHRDHRSFPWDPLSHPIVEDIGICKYKEYFLPAECWHFMRARLRQGFMLYSVALIDETKSGGTKSTSTNGNRYIGQTIDEDNISSNFQKKETVIIVFVLHWQPNITVEYRIKSLWTSSLRHYLKTIALNQEKLINIPEGPHILENDNIFTCMRAPRAQIIIKSTASFTHMLSNWDQFQRRNQMMAVQGAKSSIDLTGAPGFIKVGKMKRLLERLAETDGMLKQLVQFNLSDKIGTHNPSNDLTEPFLKGELTQSNLTKPTSTLERSTQFNYIQKFSSHWAKLERSELRVFNMCWYDEQYFNLIIESSITPNNIRDYRLDGTNTIVAEYDEMQLALDQIHAKLELWSTFISEDQQVYVKIVNLEEATNKAKSLTSDKKLPFNAPTSSKRQIIPQFCELRTVRETDKALCVKLMFFNVDIRHRHLITEELQSILTITPQQNDQIQTLASLEIKSPSIDNFGMEGQVILPNPVTLTKRPLSSLLMRDATHFLPTGTEFENGKSFNIAQSPGNSNNMSSKSMWFINPAMILTGEYIVQNYLIQHTWHWDARDIPTDKQSYDRYFAPVLNLAFEHIAVARLIQKWSLITFSKTFAHFYKEIQVDDSDSVYSVQYYIWKDPQLKRISTELWLEPLSDQDSLKFKDAIKTNVFERDKQILSQLITFDLMCGFGQSHSKFMSDILSDQMEIDDETRGVVKWMQRSSLFNLSSVLRLGSFLFAMYPCPNYDRHFHPDGNDSAVVDHQQQQACAAATAAVSSSMSTPPLNVPETPDPIGYVRRRNGASIISSGIPGATPRSRTVSKFSPAGSPLVSKTPLIWHSDTKSSTTCTCPRPDELICAEKDDISKLRPVYRDVALLHYYVENSFFTVTDRSMSLNKAPVDEFGSFIIKELLHSEKIGASRSTLYATQNFRDLRCFIKIFDPSVFVVILIPRLDAIVRGLCNMDLGNISSQEYTFDKMGLMMFECHRQDSGNNYGTSIGFDQIRVRPMDPLSSKEWLESLRSTLRPELSRGFFSSDTINEPLSDRTLRLMQDVAQVYSRSFVKSIFTCLLHGRAIDSEDFEKVLEICDESNLDIDLTGYLNVQTLLKRKSRTSEEELISANQRFISVLGHYFEPVIISNTKWTNMYCYRPPFAKVGQKLGLSLSSGEKPSNLADVVVCAQNPLFVRLECTLRRPNENGVGFTETTFPLKTLPVSYEGESEDGNKYSYEPESVGTKFSPVDSADGTTATLHLVCMTLPKSSYDPPNALFSHKSACPADSTAPHQASFLDAEKTHRARLPTLSQDKQDALVETEARLTWLFTEEIMHGLLRSGPITQNVIRYIEAQLKKKNPFVDFPTTTFIPLSFVKNQKESRRTFFEELEKHTNSPYRLIRVGDCFYASDNGTDTSIVTQQNISEDDDSLYYGEGLNITTDNSVRKKAGSGEQGSDEFCEGLGISILEPETPDEEEVDAIKQEPLRPQLYWLLLIPQAQNVQIYFYSKMQQSVNRSEIIRVTKTMVNEVMERTNKMSLLRHLHDTRRCSKYLIAPTDDEKPAYSSGDESSEEDDSQIVGSGNNLVEILSTSGEEATFAPPKKFVPGQFNCEIVFTKRFPLHWRLQPNSALNKLMTDTLPPFLVKNKPGMFVISHNDAVVYCVLTEVSTTIHSSTLSDSMTQSFISTSNNETDEYYSSHPESPYGLSAANVNDANDVLGTSSHSRIRHTSHMYNKPSPQGSTGSERQQFSPRNSPSFTDTGVLASSPVAGKRPNGRPYEGRELVLEVYGVESDGYIVDGLVEMIDSRITSEITLKEVQQFLVRNPNSKLSRADIDFILPIDKEPLLRKQLSIPSIVENMVQFLKIFRKNILSGSSLHPIQSNYLSATIKKQHDLRYSSYGNSDLNNRLLGENNSKSSIEEWSCLDLSFYYNYMNRAPGMYLPFEQRIGEGVAGICLSVINEDDLAYSKITSSHIPGDPINNKDYRFSINDLKSCLNSDFEQADSDGKLRVCIDIWSHCKIDVEQIYLYFHKSFRQSICDYIIENAVSFIPKQSTSDPNTSLQDGFRTAANLLMFALQKASEWESSTVKNISRSINLTPWYFDGLLQQLKLDLTDIHPSLEPTISRAKLSSKIYDSQSIKSYDPINYKLYTPGQDENDTAVDETDHQSAISVKRTFAHASTLNKKVSLKDLPSITKQLKENEKRQSTEVPLFDHKNYQYLIISGLPELYSKYVSSPSNIRRSSTETFDNISRISGRAMFGGGVNSILEEEPNGYFKSNDGLKRDDTGSLHSRQESLASSVSKVFPPFLSKQKTSDYKEISHQHSFIVLTLASDELSIYAYNCSDNFTEHVYNSIYKNVVQQETRHMALGNILHQKLGLFHHIEPMSKILCHNNDIPHVSVASSVLPQFPSTPLPHSGSLQHSALTQVQSANNGRGPMSPNVANTIGRLIQNDSSSSILTLDSVANDRRKVSVPTATNSNVSNKRCPVDLEILRHLVINTFDYTSRFKTGSTLNLQRFVSNETSSSFQLHPVFDTADNAKLCRVYKPNADSVYTAVRGANANTLLRDGYAESTEENKTGYEKDYLLRHGEPYLEMYLARSKPLAAHEKAFKVYTKWADQIYGPGHTKTTDEMMTVEELKQILKASRLLHFCRTPLIFSESTTFFSEVTNLNVVGGYEKLFTRTSVSKSEEMTTWYERLARGFMREYASYLESIGMHLIVHGPSNNQQDEIEAYLSRFTITENYSVDSPVVYLLQVFEGGSIMCEVRLTGAFVSVTLYTLHRRYGRLQHSPYIQRRKEVGRANFQSFMGECDQFKQRIHVNSFVFDFHLRYIQRSLDDVELLPVNLNLLSIIKNTVSVYDRPAIYSRNRIINGIYEFPVEDSLSTLSSWILRHGSKLNLKTLKADKIPVACFVSSDDLSFENSKSANESLENAPFRYTLIICPAEKNNTGRWRDSISVHRQGSFDMMGSNTTQKLVSRIVAAGNGNEFSRRISLQYFILVTYRGMDRCTSSDRCQRAWSEVLKDKPRRYANFLDEVLVPETFKMNDVFESAKLKIDEIINKAIHFFHREADWNKLYEIVRPNLTKELPEDLVKLTSRFNSINLGKIDPSFNKFIELKGLNWNDALDNLKLFYKMTSGEIHIKDTRHVLLFIPNAVSPTFFHFVYTPGEKCIATINTKDRKEIQKLREDEKAHISHLATNLSYYIWKRVHYY